MDGGCDAGEVDGGGADACGAGGGGAADGGFGPGIGMGAVCVCTGAEARSDESSRVRAEEAAEGPRCREREAVPEVPT
jgi:hypothetical protein